MLRSSCLYKSLQLGMARTCLLTKRCFQYQNEIYVSNFEWSQGDETRRHRLAQANESRSAQPNLHRFIRAYQENGFKMGRVNPLGHHVTKLDELDLKNFGLSGSQQFPVDNLLFSTSKSSMTIDEIESYLREVYANKMTIEFDYIQNEEEKLWIATQFEKLQCEPISATSQLESLKLMLKSQALDHFLALKFPTFKRYSLEGGESAMAFYHSLLSNAAKDDIEQLVMGIAHRGRLNLMVCLLGLEPKLLFQKIKGRSEFSSDVVANGDISHHFPCSTDFEFDSKKLHVSLLPNPSHLEAVDPLVLGKARSKQMFQKDGFYSSTPSANGRKVASFLIHGDAAFAGQGIVSETFQLYKLPNYSVGGTVHLLVNNQIGFTTTSNLGRSGNFNSDLAKGFNCPIIHVNGDDPESAWKAAQFAINYRNKFAKDVVVDLICFRKYGHNELDDPTFTNPLMYKSISAHESVPNLFEKKLLERNVAQKEALSKEISDYKQWLEEAFNQVVNSQYKIEPRNTYLNKQWANMSVPSNTERTFWNTGFSPDLLKYIGVKSVTYPENMKIHPTIERAHVKRRIERMKEAKNIDWSTAEALAFGSLLLQGYNVRLSGQDVGRGTFSHRHALLIDQENNRSFVPLNSLNPNQANFLEICNSNLSEEAVMGFEYGFSLDNPRNLVIWEAQFGDFFNGAQIIIDTYISSGETKWMHQSGLVLLMPHGFDGAGPEHSSCRIERFLQMSSSKEDAVDSDNINYFVCHPTTPANYFHMLRRQMILPFRKPLIVASPKSLLRLPECVSSLSEFDDGTQFEPVFNDSRVQSKDAVKRLIFVFGKHFYALDAERQSRNINDVALIRIEELSPFPAAHLRELIKQYKNAKEFVWAQEEHRNMGAWFFVAPRFENVLGVKLKYAGRDVNSAVVGTGTLHAAEVKHVLNKPFDKL